ncbi:MULTISPECIES: hypothetical protein [unclassified Moorena]|nr:MULTISPECIES: hypothetical protein [unclassified Moorena]
MSDRAVDNNGDRCDVKYQRSLDYVNKWSLPDVSNTPGDLDVRKS